MKAFIHASRATLAALAIVAAMMVFGSSNASAIAWNPPCGITNVINNTACIVGICPIWNPGIPIPCSPFTNPGMTSNINTAFPGLQLMGFFSWGGTAVGLTPIPLGSGAPCAPMATFVVRNIIVGPAPGCCVDIYVNPAGCNIVVCPPSGGPCIP